MSSSALAIWEAPRELMSSSCIDNPDVAPRPGMAGGLTANTMPCCSEAHLSSMRSMMASTEWDFPLRSFQGLSMTNIEPRLLPEPPAMKEKPDISMTSSTSGISRMMSDTWATILSVRSSEASVGSCTEAMK